jgi:hypothetical protein
MDQSQIVEGIPEFDMSGASSFIADDGNGAVKFWSVESPCGHFEVDVARDDRWSANRTVHRPI